MAKIQISEQKYASAYDTYEMIPPNILIFETADSMRKNLTFNVSVAYEKVQNYTSAITLYDSVPRNHFKYKQARINRDKILMLLTREG